MANVYDSEDLKKAEGSNTSGSSSTAPGNVSYTQNVPESEKSLYKSSSTSPGKISFGNSFLKKRKKWLIGGTATGVVGGGAAFFIFFSGPFQFIHFAQLLQKFHFSNNESFSDGRSSRMIIYTIAGQANKGRLGFVGNQYADKWEAKLIKEAGLRPVYTTVTNRFAGFEIVDPDKARSFIAEAEKDGINTSAPDKNVVNRSKGPTGKFIDYRDGKFREKRSAIRTVGRGTDTTKIAGAMGSRLLIKRGGVDFHPLKNIKRKAGDSLVKYYQKVKDERVSRDRNGVPKDTKDVRPGEEDRDGDGKNEVAQEDKEAADKANEIIGSAKDADSKGAEGSKTMKSLRSGLTKSATPAVIVGALCTAKAYGEDIVNEQHKIIIMPMMRMGMRIISTGGQVMSGQDVNMDELGSIADDLNDPDDDEKGPDTGSSWTQAKSIQAEQGQPLTGPDLPLEAKPSRVGEKPALINALDSVPALKETCSVLDAVSRIPIIKQAGQVASAAISGTADLFLASFDTSVDKLMQSAISLAAGRGVDPYAQGAELGNIANYGARLAANDQALAMGGRELTSQEVAVLDSQSKLNHHYESSQRSFAQKYLDPYDGNSALSLAMSRAPKSIEQLTGSLSSPAKFFSNFFTTFGNLMPKTQAAGPSNYNYGFDEFGFSANEQADERFENPYENAEKVKDRLPELNDKYGDCFATLVIPDPADPQRVLIKSGDSINYATRNKAKCNDGSDDLLRYRFFLADTVTAHSLACYEGDSDSCSQLGVSSTSGSSTSNPVESPGTAIDISQLGKSSDGLKCAEGTKDLGVVTSLYAGEFKKEAGPMKIRLCQVVDIPGFGNDTSGNNVSGGAVVEARVSGAWAALAKKAKTDGVGLTASSSFRLAHSCGGTGDGVACARPGQSAHQTGWAIDFNNMPDRGGSTTSCSTRARSNTTQWKWMYENAENFGIKQYTYEAWHWDFIPMDNRCGKDS